MEKNTKELIRPRKKVVHLGDLGAYKARDGSYHDNRECAEDVSLEFTQMVLAKKDQGKTINIKGKNEEKFVKS